ncbi:RING-H2 finger protein ATL46 [Humulus lupulus]|uniref:RING-H2 finger protein ATL46 n=1 Tax=Humulus lupulus TaxID=3486 RepID=UPI002B40E1E9|nr:RING-H2 finger protein ATL46 [Humulus lupulus]
MSRIQLHILQKDGYMGYSPPFVPTSSSPYSGGFHKETPIPPSSSSSSQSPSSSGTKISPAVLFIIVILAVLFFISGLLHLLVRFLIKHPSSSATSQSNRYPELSTSDALQRQLQQLFHLHDSGLDQAFIDALPVFHYKEIVGLKEPFDCAVCLCEFSEKDKLRLLPVCSHAFHINCIDTWLLSNSTCPLCRGTLFTPGYSIENPMFDFDDFQDDGRSGIGGYTSSQKTVEIEETAVVNKKGVLPVRLGKFRKVNVEAAAGESGIGETSSSNLDARRCYSMGSYQYVLDDSVLRVPLSTDRLGQDIRLSKATEQGNPTVDGDMEGKKISSVSKGESYSVSKIWLWSKKGKFSTSTDSQTGMPSSLNMDLPWMEKSTPGV